jgi:hypothetical protein
MCLNSSGGRSDSGPTPSMMRSLISRAGESDGKSSYDHEITTCMSQKSKLAGQGWARTGHGWALIVPRDVMGNPPNEMGNPGHAWAWMGIMGTIGHACPPLAMLNISHL